ncbi:MAG: alpha/beta hydrolase [Thermosynechococcaceae cyanobacterium MS004]|nr:alpha/beta hydrolase [Thermosynechococcaceae cyanobacterium MS004]
MKKTYLSLGLTAMAASFPWIGLTQAGGKPEAAIAQAASPPPLYRTQTIPCPVPLPLETEGKTVTCGVLTVPENYDQPKGRQVEITYARFYSTSLSPLPDPVFYLEGGPGGSAVSLLDVYSRVIFAPLRQTRDVVFFDQRGTQFSSSLGCAPTAFALDKLGKQFDQYVKKLADNNPLTDDRTIAQYAVCAQVLQKNGFDLSQFNTPNNARDTVNLAAALGYKQINLYGISYGTYLAMAIARNHPTVVRSVVLDSTATPHINKYTEAGKRGVTPVVNLLEDCAADPACNQAYPNLQARLNALLEKLAKQPIPLPKAKSAATPSGAAAPTETSITLKSFAENVPGWLNLQPTFANYLPLMIAELERGNTTTYGQALSGQLFQSDPKPKGLPVIEQYRKLATNFQLKAQDLLTERATIAQAKRHSTQWVDQVKARLKTLPEPQQSLAIANFYGAGYDANRGRDRKALLTLLTEIFPAQTAQPLRAELQTMAEPEIRHIYELLTDNINQVSDVDQGGTAGMHMSFDCREHVSWSSQAETEAVNRSLPLPLLAQASYGEELEQLAICKHWPVKPADPRERQIVKINVPTLVMQGRYDAQTTTDRGKRALEWLSNGTYIEFPSLGHGVTLKPCGRDVGIAFINRPEVAPNSSCTATLKPKFVVSPRK